MAALETNIEPDATPGGDAASEAASGIEHVDVLVVGAGLSGIGAACHLTIEAPWATFAVFEARDALGGTWDLFRYPGIRSDSDMFTLGFPFRPWNRTESIASGENILNYLRDTADEFGVTSHIRYRHRIIAADFHTDDDRWHVTAERTTDDGDLELVNITASYYVSASGYYRYDRGHTPTWEGQDEFTGQIVHPQFWPEDLDYADKNVVVIGSGATAITLVPSMTDKAAKVTMLQRSPTYIGSLPAVNPVTSTIRRFTPKRYHGSILRWYNSTTTQAFYQLSRKRPEFVKKLLLKATAQQLPNHDVKKHFTPKYNPWDQRFCVVPDGDLFKALRKGTADIVTDHIERFDANGIVLRSGERIDADIIVTATGLELLFIGGVHLSIDGEPVDIGNSMAYKGMGLEGVPNFSVIIGYTNASWTLKADLTAGYITKLLNFMRERGYTRAVPSKHPELHSDDPLLGLDAGYVLRSQADFPKQGKRDPWRLHQSYIKDYRALKMGGVADDTMVFSTLQPAVRKPAAEPVRSAS